jgi:hypothetical protein
MESGEELWGRDNEIGTRLARAVCCFGSYVYVAGWDSAKTNKYFIERRSKADGRIT